MFSGLRKLHPVTTVLLVSCMPLMAAALDLFLPALTQMVRDFETDQSTIQLNLVFSVIASAVFGFFSGIISDQIGRRQMFVFSLFGFCFGTFLCAISNNVTIFILARTFQGAFSGVIFVLVSAIISDSFKGVKKSQILGIGSFLFPLMLGFAPFIGEKIYAGFGWNMTFYALGVVIAFFFVLMWFLLPETLEKTKKAPSIGSFVREARDTGKIAKLLENIMMPAVFMGAFISFVAHSPFVYMSYFGLGSDVYVYYFIAPLAFQFAMGILYQVLIQKWGNDRTLMFGGLLIIFAVLTILMMGLHVIPTNPISVMLSMIFYNSAIPFILPIAMAKAFDLFPESGGTISSLASIIRNITMAVFVFISSHLSEIHPLTILVVLFAGGVITMGLMMLTIRKPKEALSINY